MNRELDIKVLTYIHERGVPVTPTEIGMEVLRVKYSQASSRANPILKRLLAAKKIKRAEGSGKYVAMK